MTTEIAKKFKIEAEAHSDDRAVEVSFDAQDWFRDASPSQIIDLLTCDIGSSGLGGDYPSDQVAIDMGSKIDELADMFKYIELRNKIEHIGFECHIVDYEAAIKYLCEQRPVIFETMEWKTRVADVVEDEILELVGKDRTADRQIPILRSELGEIRYLLNLARVHNLWGDFEIAKSQADDILAEIDRKLETGE